MNIADYGFSSFNKTLSRVDFPAFVSPMIATGTPFLIALPTLKEFTKRTMTFQCYPLTDKVRSDRQIPIPRDH